MILGSGPAAGAGPICLRSPWSRKAVNEWVVMNWGEFAACLSPDDESSGVMRMRVEEAESSDLEKGRFGAKGSGILMTKHAGPPGAGDDR